MCFLVALIQNAKFIVFLIVKLMANIFEYILKWCVCDCVSEKDVLER